MIPRKRNPAYDKRNYDGLENIRRIREDIPEALREAIWNNAKTSGPEEGTSGIPQSWALSVYDLYAELLVGIPLPCTKVTDPLPRCGQCAYCKLDALR